MKSKYKVGYTAGVYDMFHIGHLNVLRRSSERCHKLIVGVTSDELVRERKNKDPFIPLNERMEIIGALRCVDEIVIQENMDKVAMVKELECDVVFVGNDWKGTAAWKMYEVEFNKIGVDVVYLPHTTHTSSSKLQDALELERQMH